MTAANATSYRRRFRYANELRRYSQTAKWGTVAVPKPPQFEIGAVGGGAVRAILKLTFNADLATTPLLERSANGTSGWTDVPLTGWAAGTKSFLAGGLTPGLLYFRMKTKNAFGTSASSNVMAVTVT